MLDQAVLEVLAEEVRAEFVSDDAPPVDGDQLLQDVAGFIGRYLQCSHEQLHLLAVWVLHTYCLDAMQVTPYLAIQSTAKQAGKTLCLQLLKLLCNDAGLTAGFTLSKLTQWTDTGPRTLLLDECQAVIGTRNRSKSPALRAVLASGFHKGLGYTESFCQRDIFCAKAFAGQGPLPEELAERALAIILKPIRSGVVHEARGAQPPGSPVRGGFFAGWGGGAGVPGTRGFFAGWGGGAGVPGTRGFFAGWGGGAPGCVFYAHELQNRQIRPHPGHGRQQGAARAVARMGPARICRI